MPECWDNWVRQKFAKFSFFSKLKKMSFLIEETAWVFISFSVISAFRHGLVVRIAGSHPAGPGSIPGAGKLFSSFYIQSSWHTPMYTFWSFLLIINFQKVLITLLYLFQVRTYLMLLKILIHKRTSNKNMVPFRHRKEYFHFTYSNTILRTVQSQLMGQVSHHLFVL